MFHKLELDDIEWIESCLSKDTCYSCDYSPFNLFAWRGTYFTEIGRIDDYFIGRIIVDDKWLYLYPCGTGDIDLVIDKMCKYHSDNYDYPFMFMCNRTQADYLGDGYEKELRPGYADYIYNTEDLLELKGSKYHKKRNLIAQFNKNYSCELIPLSDENLEDAKELMKRWHEQTGAESYEEELVVLELAVNYAEKFNITSCILYADHTPVALAIGTFPGNDTLDVHVEKADTSFIGVYAKIMNEFIKYASKVNCVKYVNREEDMGIDNLKKAKLSLYPAFLEEKWVCTKKL